MFAAARDREGLRPKSILVQDGSVRYLLLVIAHQHLGLGRGRQGDDAERREPRRGGQRPGGGGCGICIRRGGAVYVVGGTAGSARWGPLNHPAMAVSIRTLGSMVLDVMGFVSLCEALDLTTPSGRALAGMLAIFAEFERDILRDRVKAGIDQARKDGKPHGRPVTAGKLVGEMRQLRQDGLSKRAIAKRLGVSRPSVIRLLRCNKHP